MLKKISKLANREWAPQTQGTSSMDPSKRRAWSLCSLSPYNLAAWPPGVLCTLQKYAEESYLFQSSSIVVAEVYPVIVARTTRAVPPQHWLLSRGKCLWPPSQIAQAQVSALGVPSQSITNSGQRPAHRSAKTFVFKWPQVATINVLERREHIKECKHSVWERTLGMVTDSKQIAY